MPRYFDGYCNNPECEDKGKKIPDVEAPEGIDANGKIIGSQCAKCRGKLTHLFSAPHIGGKASKNAENTTGVFCKNSDKPLSSEEKERAASGIAKLEQLVDENGQELLGGAVFLHDDHTTVAGIIQTKGTLAPHELN
ncbi:MAG: hypothetical protein WCX61_04710 [Candidatus Peribacteraceae bacterium]|jgi:hypothetical protein